MTCLRLHDNRPQLSCDTLSCGSISHLHSFEFERPTSVDEAVALFKQHGDNARALAGGTDLIVQMRIGRRTPGVVVDMKHIPEVSQITWDPESGLTVGASVPSH